MKICCCRTKIYSRYDKRRKLGDYDVFINNLAIFFLSCENSQIILQPHSPLNLSFSGVHARVWGKPTLGGRRLNLFRIPVAALRIFRRRRPLTGKASS